MILFVVGWLCLLSPFGCVEFGLVGCVQVVNVDDDGNELGAGIMELTEDELVLRTRKCDAVKWPYLCLRRYGYDSNLFSFESGRRCQTGQGKTKISHTIHSGTSYLNKITSF